MSAVDVASQIEGALLEHPSVADCAVLARTTLTGEARCVAYVVPSGAVTVEALRAAVTRRLPDAQPPSVLLLSSLPVTPSGALDRAALERLPIADASVAHSWEKALRGAPGVAQLTVRLEPSVSTREPLHLAELLEEGQRASPGGEKETRSAAATVSAEAVPLSVSTGAPIRWADDAPQSLMEALQKAAQAPHRPGITFLERGGVEQRLSYAELWEQALRILGGLQASGLEAGAHVVLQLERNADFVAAFWACVLGGLVPVPVGVASTYQERSAATQKLRNAWMLLDQAVVLASRTVGPQLLARAALHEMEGVRVCVVDELRQAAPVAPHPSKGDDLALMLLTSGSTGVPKLVMQTHRAILSRSAATVQMNGFVPEDVSLNWLPLDHVGSLVMFHVRDVFTRCQQVLAPIELVLEAPIRWLEWMERYRATITWAPNFAYGLVNSLAAELATRRFDLSKMRFVLNGGEAIVAKQARRFLELLAPHGLPRTAMHPAWGMSETCSGVTFSHGFSLETTSDDDPHVVVGHAVPGFSMRIVDGSGRVVPEGHSGALEVRGPSVTQGYYRNPEVNAESFSADGWFRTGDLAVIRGGQLTITGRQKDVIIVNGLNFASHEIEAVVEEVPGVSPSFTAAVAVRRPGDATDRLAVFFHPHGSTGEALTTTLAAIRERIVRALGLRAEYVVPVERDEVPKTAIGKIQRAQLRERLEKGHFDAVLRKLDRQAGNAKTLPDWFFRPTWVRRRLRTEGLRLAGRTVLVLMDGLGLGERVAAQLEAHGARCVRVETGSDFEELGGGRYRVVVGNPSHYERLLESVSMDAGAVDDVIHLWTYEGTVGEPARPVELEQAQERGVHSLLFLTQSLARANGHRRRGTLLCVSSQVQAVDPKDPVAYARGSVLGLVKSLGAELPWLHARHLDLAPSTGEAQQTDVAAIVAELGARGREREVAYRQGERFVSRFEHVDLRAQPEPSPTVREGALYLVTGGLGGVGVEVCRWLLKAGARLLVIGRTALPSGEARAAVHETGGRAAERLRRLEALEALGPVRYAGVDLVDEARLSSALDEAEVALGAKLAGIFHLAAELSPGGVESLTPVALSRALHAKVLGSWSLDRVLTRRGGELFVGFSSVNGFFGGAGVGAYAAACSFQEAFGRHQRARRPYRTYTLSFSMWKDLGMSAGRGDQDLTWAAGFQVMTPAQAMGSLAAALRRPAQHLLAGLDEDAPALQWLAHVEARPLEALRGYYTTVSGKGSRPSAREIADAFGTAVPCRLALVDVLPTAVSGPALETSSSTLHAPSVDARSAEEVAATVRALWKELLELPEVSLDDNFFELGGHSLLIPRLQAEVKARLGRELSNVDVFRHPTVRALATYLSNAAGGRQRASVEPALRFEQVVEGMSALWKELLELPEVSLDDNFFELGGHSLLIPRLQAGVKERLDREISNVDVFKHPTVRAFATFLTQRQAEAAAVSPAAADARQARGAAASRQRQLRQKP